MIENRKGIARYGTAWNQRQQIMRVRRVLWKRSPIGAETGVEQGGDRRVGKTNTGVPRRVVIRRAAPCRAKVGSRSFELQGAIGRDELDVAQQAEVVRARRAADLLAPGPA